MFKALGADTGFDSELINGELLKAQRTAEGHLEKFEQSGRRSIAREVKPKAPRYYREFVRSLGLVAKAGELPFYRLIMRMFWMGVATTREEKLTFQEQALPSWAREVHRRTFFHYFPSDAGSHPVAGAQMR